MEIVNLTEIENRKKFMADHNLSVYEVTDTTPFLEKRPKIIQCELNKRVEGIFTGRRMWFLKKICTVMRDSNIIMDLVPYHLEDVKLYVFKAKISGKLKIGYLNKSEPGWKSKMEQFRWMACPTDEDPGYVRQIIEKSAEIFGELQSKLETAGVKIGDLTDKFPIIGKMQTYAPTLKFSQKGIKGSYVQSLRNLAGDERIKVSMNANVKVQHEGVDGSTKTGFLNYKIVGDVPVKGKIKLDFSVF